MNFLLTDSNDFYTRLKSILEKRTQQNIGEIDNDVKIIIDNVIERGDNALFEYAKKFDGTSLNKNNIKLSNSEILKNKDLVDVNIVDAFKVAINNVTNFHKKQFPNNYEIINQGVKTSSVWKPIQSVGLYIPGGNASYPSSLIMNAIPAIVAGVKRIVVVTPSRSQTIDPYIFFLLNELNITEIYQIGGAHAIAALAYGTESIKPVNKIFGPGNAYIASAKKQVFGKVGIDLIAGPSEIVVVADNDNNPSWVAADLIAQAEHDINAQSILITNSDIFASKVHENIREIVKKLPKKNIINQSLANYGVTIIDKDFQNTPEIIDFIAPEHLHLQNKLRNQILAKVNNAGGIFIGEYSSEAFGDYIVGTNHILPTSGSAKFSSGLGVLDFMKRSSIVEMSYEGFVINEKNVSKMAEVEGLEGHKYSVKIRQTVKK